MDRLGPCAGCRRPALAPDNETPLALFFASLTQRLEGFGGTVGLSYPGVEAAARMLRIDMTPDIFAGVRAGESEWLQILAERRTK